MGSRNVVLLMATVAFSLAFLMETNAVAADQELVSFRMTQWKSVHFDNAQAAQTNLATLKQIGCEAEQMQHDGHIDLRFRCVKWRSISLKSHQEAHQWETWLKAFGFETMHRH